MAFDVGMFLAFHRGLWACAVVSLHKTCSRVVHDIAEQCFSELTCCICDNAAGHNGSCHLWVLHDC
jgi:hypothetical protein